jgi:L-asparagine transporter-like permease
LFTINGRYLFEGISATLGSGIYILAGSVIGEFTGPAVMLSFVFAGIATFMSGMCYAEVWYRNKYKNIKTNDKISIFKVWCQGTT